MRNRLIMVAALFALPTLILAQESGTTRATPDLSGVWSVVQEPDGPGVAILTLEEPPLQPWAMEIYKRNRMGVTDPREGGRDEWDPNNYCFPPGPTRAMIYYPFEVLQAPNKVVMLFEVGNGVRHIFMDGREHPEGWPFGWMGHSIGKWDGDSLVVDTVGLNDRTWIDRGGAPHSNALHVVERIRRVDHDTLEVEILLEDPKAFTKPWGGKRVYQLRPDWDIIESVQCEGELEIGGPIRQPWD